MRINFHNIALYNNRPVYNSFNNPTDTAASPVGTDLVAFKQGVPSHVTEYIIRRGQELGDLRNFLSLYHHKKLEGLQNGIKIFEGISFEKIAYLISKLRGVVIQRGCNNACIHCFADAKTPHYMKINGFDSKISFEDYENLTSGFVKLRERLGFNPFNHSRDTYKSLFFDADSSMIFLRDKYGKIHDYADLSKMLYDMTDNTILFDTAGWNINDKQTQKRMEDLVQKVINSDNYDFLKFNVSINPFQSIYNRSVELKQKGDIENSKKLREIYTDRMANVIFTLSPLTDKYNPITHKPMLDFIIRGMKYNSELQSYTEWEILDVCKEIQKKVEKLFEQDLLSDYPKVINDESQKQLYMTRIKKELSYADKTVINLTNKKLISKYKSSNPDETQYTKSLILNSEYEGKFYDDGFLDVNGKFYMTNYAETYPTNIVLNYSNKGKPTAPIAPNLSDKTIII